jgi:hypothetical protein
MVYLILYNLLPDDSSQPKEKNFEQKRNFLNIHLSIEIGKTGNLYRAVYELLNHSSKIVSKFAKILYRKLDHLSDMASMNIKSKYCGQKLPYPRVKYIDCYSKGIGIRNISKQSIKKGRLIGEFFGEVLEIWR